MLDDVNVQIGYTRGKNTKFEWVQSVKGITIRSEKEKTYSYSTIELVSALMWLYCKFGQTAFPLANQSELLAKGEEQDGFGKALYTIKPQAGYVQGASYLALILEQLDVLEYIKGSPIQWRIKDYEQANFHKIIEKLIS